MGRRVASRQGEQVLNDDAHALGAVERLAEHVLRLRATVVVGDEALKGHAELLEVEHHVGQRVVDLVGDPGGQRAHRRHSVRLDEPTLHPLSLGDVAAEAEEAGRAFVLDRDRGDLDGDDLAAGMDHPVLVWAERFAREDPLHPIREDAHVVPMDDLAELGAHVDPSEEAPGGWVQVEDLAVADQMDRVGRCFGERPESALGGSEPLGDSHLLGHVSDERHGGGASLVARRRDGHLDRDRAPVARRDVEAHGASVVLAGEPLFLERGELRARCAIEGARGRPTGCGRAEEPRRGLAHEDRTQRVPFADGDGHADPGMIERRQDGVREVAELFAHVAILTRTSPRRAIRCGLEKRSYSPRFSSEISVSTSSSNSATRRR